MSDALTIEAVTLPKGADALMDTWFDLLAGEPNWVPPLRFERRQFLDPKRNPYFATADVQFFLARRGGRAVGTISAQVDRGYQETGPGTGFFGFFEFDRDPRVAAALLDAARGWLRARGMHTALGPFNFNSNHECGLLVDTFDQDPLVMTTWNPSWYPATYDHIGLAPARDLYGWWFEGVGAVPARIRAIHDRFRQRHPEVVVRAINTDDWAAEVARARELYNAAWAANWGFVRLTEAEFDHVARDLKPLVDPRFCFVVEVGGRPAGFSLSLPDLNQAVKPMRGALFPFGWWCWLTRKRRMDRLRVYTLGIHPDFQRLPLGLPLYVHTWEAAAAAGISKAEASWVLDTNTRMNGAIEKLGARRYRTWRIYACAL
jgi:GNAT superfamily N-acetyltransferase